MGKAGAGFDLVNVLDVQGVRDWTFSQFDEASMVEALHMKTRKRAVKSLG
jgi:hypothetical protein